MTTTVRAANESGGEAWDLIEVPCAVCGGTHNVLVPQPNRSKWQGAQFAACPLDELPDNEAELDS
jgi:hypothetical protein